MIRLPKEITETLNDEETVKMLTTLDEKGFPHTVIKDTLKASEDGYLAYMELLETSQTQMNMLGSYWFKKDVSISLYNKKSGVAYQVKGEPYRFVYEGTLWDQFLQEVWKLMPDADPAGVWLIDPKLVINQDYKARREDQKRRRPNSLFWFGLMGRRPGGVKHWKRVE